jgi:heme exporter protein A
VASVQQLVARGIVHRFGPTTVLRGVGAIFDSSTITVLEGANGAGKSTFLSILGGLLRPSGGSVCCLPQAKDPAQAREYFGWVGHDSFAYRELTAKENVELAVSLYGRGGSWEEVASRVGAESLKDRRLRTMSRGQRQRVALGRALVHRPDVLLLDEPFSGLDVEGVASLERVLLQERERGAIVIAVSHDSSFGERMGARRVVLRKGRLSELRCPVNSS